MKLELLHIFDDGREAFIANHCGEEWGVIVRSFDGSWPAFAVDRFSRTALEAARDEAMEVDGVMRDKAAGFTRIKSRDGNRAAYFSDDGQIACLQIDMDGEQITRDQASAFRWLFMGRLD